jgi:hypothetical protein
MSGELTNKPLSSRAVIDAFLEKHAVQPRGRLIFALDATASREPAWDLATSLTAKMFEAVGGLPLNVQLIYYRGISECQKTGWLSDARALTGKMKAVRCEAGETQIGRVLKHAQRENAERKVSALIFIGDSVEENPDTLCGAAARLGLPVFLFLEGNNPHAAKVFGDIARLTKGAYCRFDQGSAKQLAELLGAVAAYAAGGREALEARKDAGAIKLLQQLR